MYERCAQDALRQYGMENMKTELLRHNENMTYYTEGRYMLRIHQHKTGFETGFIYAGLDRRAVYGSEMELLAHLKKLGIRVQEPVKNKRGEWITDLPDGATAVLLKWLPGMSLDRLEADEALCREIGKLTAELHQSTRDFKASPVVRYDAAHCLRLRDDLLTRGRDCIPAPQLDILAEVCAVIAARLNEAEPEFQIIHGDLSPSNIVRTELDFAPIDFSMFGLGHPMLDLAGLFAQVNGLKSRQAVAAGYTEHGGVIRYDVLDACFALSILQSITIHLDTWSEQDWFQSRMDRWCNQSFAPLCREERLFADGFFLIHAK